MPLLRSQRSKLLSSTFCENESIWLTIQCQGYYEPQYCYISHTCCALYLLIVCPCVCLLILGCLKQRHDLDVCSCHLKQYHNLHSLQKLCFILLSRLEEIILHACSDSDIMPVYFSVCMRNSVWFSMVMYPIRLRVIIGSLVL